MKLTLSKTHHLVTEKYGHLDVAATVELDSLHENATPEAANLLLDMTVEPTLERLNRSLQEDSDLEFIQAFIAAK